MWQDGEDVDKAFTALSKKRIRLEKEDSGTAQAPRKRLKSDNASLSLGAPRPKDGVVIVCRPDGRLCRLCGIKDTDMDIVIQTIPMKWGYPLSADGRNQGKVCWYCVRVCTARYKCRFTIAVLESEMGRTIETRNEFMWFLENCKQVFIKAGTHDISVDWDAAARKVITQKQQSLVSFEEPDDEFWPIDQYVDRYGDPAVNGKGHTRKSIQGIDGVITRADQGALQAQAEPSAARRFHRDHRRRLLCVGGKPGRRHLRRHFLSALLHQGHWHVAEFNDQLIELEFGICGVGQFCAECTAASHWR